MGVEQYSLIAHDWLNLEFIINDLASRVIGQELSPGSSPTWVGATFTGKIDIGSQASPVDVTNTRKYGVEFHFSGNDYDVIALRARAQFIISDTTATAQGALLQAANNDGIDVGVLNGAVIEAIGKSDTTAATISTMRGALIGTEWGDYDTVTNLKTLHIRGHSKNATGAGSFGTGYGIYIENEAVGGNGQAYGAGIYFKGTNLSAGNKAFTYGIDFTGATYGTANIKVTEGGTIGGTGADLRINSNNQVIVNKTSNTYPFLIKSTDGSDQISFYHNNSDAIFKTSDGAFVFQTDEGDNTSSRVLITGKGTGHGILQISDQDAAESFYMECISGRARWYCTGANPVAISLQSTADIPVDCFVFATEGQTPKFQIYGFGEGSGGKESLDISVEQYAANTADFFGLDAYMFGGNLITKDFTHSDADGAGATSWTAKRERSGGEEADIFSIIGSHDGIGDDQLAKIVLGINTGSGVVDALEIGSDLLTTFAGDITSSNYSTSDEELKKFALILWEG